MNRPPEHNFIVTHEYRRFAEFCEACQRYRYIGLCYGPPGVGKTLSAQHYTDWERMAAVKSLPQAPVAELEALQGKCSLLYTPAVMNSPGQVGQAIQALRQSLCSFHLEPLNREEKALRERVRSYEQQRAREQEERWRQHNGREEPLPEEPTRTEPTVAEIGYRYLEKRHRIVDPTRLIIVDEADRLRMASLEQLRAIFDQGGIGMVLLGMPGLEKRLARYPQLYSRVGFVHEFRPLNAEEVRQLLQQHWKPPEISHSLNGMTEEDVVATIVRITGGNFRLIHRLLSQVARVMEINALPRVTKEVVEAARESLVIGTR